MWRHLLGSWIKQQARAHLYETAMREGAETLGDAQASEAQLAQPLAECDVGLIFALGIEAGSLQDKLSESLVTRGDGFRVRQGLLGEHRVGLITCGIGSAAARRGTERLLVGHRPRWLITTGFSGALQPQLRRGDIVMGSALRDTGGHRLDLELKISAEQLAEHRGVHLGELLTSEQIIKTPAEKRSLGEQSGALAVDMESFAVGQVCRERKVPLLAVRVVSDALEDELPDDVLRLAESRSMAGKLGAITGTLWRRPSSVKDMLRLQERALEAADRLAKFLVGVIAQLPRSERSPSEDRREQEER